MGASFRPVSFLFLFLAFLFLPNFFFFFCTGLSELRCIDTERLALLNFKQHLIDHSNRLSSWTAHGDCCLWEGVVCHNHTAHVHELHLRTSYPEGDFSTDEQYEAYEQSKFGGFVGLIPHQLGNLSNLLYLNLEQGYSLFPGLYVNNLEWLSGLPLLQHLDMSFVNLSKASDWLQLTNTLPSLIDLRLSYCNLGSIPPTSSVNFSSLLTLDLSENYFENTLIPSWIFGLHNLVSLHLSYNNFHGLIPVDLQNMTSLSHLDLSVNYFNSSIPNWLYSFNRLEFLNLANNYLQGTISNAIGNLTSAISIDLSYNELGGKLPRSLGNLCNLREIRLSSNKWSQEISEILESLSGCLSDRLEILDLSTSHLHGHLTDELGVFKNLVKLFFEDNSISGPIPVSLGNLSSLTYLDFWKNSISGPFPVSFGNLQSLIYLDLSSNQFNGTLPQSVGQLSKLETLFIDSNMLKGVVSEVHFSNLTSLRTLSAGGNQLILKVSQNWIPPFQLESLYLPLWNIGPKFPQWLCSQRRILSLDISYTQISDTAPPSFWNLSSQFQYLNLSHNLINGEIPNSPMILSASVIDLSSNNFEGPLPSISSNVYVLDLSNNSFSRSISHFFCFRVNETKNIGYLNLEKNLLSGMIPDCLMNWINLVVLNLGNNNFSGSIPASIGSLTILHSLHLYNNTFSGKLPSSLKNCEELVIIDVAENRFVGNIPSWIGHRCTSLMVLSLRSNYFHGYIPKELCALTSLQILDLSHNKLFGSIPRCVNNFRAMATNNISNDLNSYRIISGYGQYLSLESALLVIKGSIREYNTILQLVKSIDFSKNNLSGEIPKEVTNLQELQSLNLSCNLLNGSIPMNIGTMVLLESVDFSMNHLSGKIPSSMSSLTFLSHLNLSNNNLTGKIPLSTQLQSLTASSFIGNNLCGPPLMENCTVNGVKPNSENTRSKDTDGFEVDWFYMSMALGFVVGFWGVCSSLLLYKPWRIMYFQFLDQVGYKLKSIVSL
ncbi:receptor-like protein EIX2 [Quercus robur]|uniref:receptor-like protein EIX2 n=1 Tax=Quercus robur TaxID=38942 RepID=UPI0021616D74|nr:receptor-like protein EIX2 [Quercus robur]